MNFFQLDLPIYPGEYAEEDVLGALKGATDNSNDTPLFNKVERGVNAELLDAYFERPGEDVCPAVFLQTWTEQETSAQGGSRYKTSYMMSLYFFYYFGVLSTDTSYMPQLLSFVQQRRRHLTAAMKAIEMQTGGNITARIPVSPHWKWDTSRDAYFDYASPFKTFSNQYIPKEGYNCVRVDRPIMVVH